MILAAGPRADRPLADLYGREIDLAAPVCGLASLADRLAVATGDGRVHAIEPALALSEAVVAHAGAILSLAVVSDRSGVLTGGDDGRVVASRPGAAPETVHEVKGRWIDHVATGPGGMIAWSEGRVVAVRGRGGGGAHTLAHPSTVAGIAIDESGRRLAVAHYGGATLWDLDGQAPRKRMLGWKGSHIGIRFSPGGKFLLTVMQENALHGWRLSDQANLRMAGYPAKPRSLSFSANGLWMATSGAEGSVLWPFKGKDGPIGKGGELLARRPSISTAVTWHPRAEVLAIGFSDGCIVLARRADQGVVLVRRPKPGAIAGLVWIRDGADLAYATEPGVVGVVAVATAIKV